MKVIIIIKLFKLILEGVVELWLTSEDTGAYGRDIGVTLPELLWQLVDVIPEGAMLRIGMTNPPYILEHLEVCFLILTLHNFVSHLTLRRALIYIRGSSNNEACKVKNMNENRSSGALDV